MYGETHRALKHAAKDGGLSPHVRGNRGRPSLRWFTLGSIPACTGKPICGAAGSSLPTVYPRMYGETLARHFAGSQVYGLSPHVRGNPCRLCLSLSESGSIPACTGKPVNASSGSPSGRVYPRMYGETSRADARGAAGNGLSPHVRGNPYSSPASHGAPGSIPACTGKPAAGGAVGRAAGVYPRMYGETMAQRSVAGTRQGLSPHVRGNLVQLVDQTYRRRSIPACTGKPVRLGYLRQPPEVYPRMYGETRLCGCAGTVSAGLSPHVRGNPGDSTPRR